MRGRLGMSGTPLAWVMGAKYFCTPPPPPSDRFGALGAPRPQPHTKVQKENVSTTGRQLPPLSSVLYRIISKRRYVLAAQLLLIAISLACLLVQ
jgi:hypothetical protein